MKISNTLHPCKNCNYGWGTVNGNGVARSCAETCDKIKEYNERGTKNMDDSKNDRLNLRFVQFCLDTMEGISYYARSNGLDPDEVVIQVATNIIELSKAITCAEVSTCKTEVK